MKSNTIKNADTNFQFNINLFSEKEGGKSRQLKKGYRAPIVWGMIDLTQKH
jgi:hypothetical protein